MFFLRGVDFAIQTLARTCQGVLGRCGCGLLVLLVGEGVLRRLVRVRVKVRVRVGATVRVRVRVRVCVGLGLG